MDKFDNQAGHKSIDDLLIAELDATGINHFTGFCIVGNLHGWTFKRSFFERVVL